MFSAPHRQNHEHADVGAEPALCARSIATAAWAAAGAATGCLLCVMVARLVPGAGKGIPALWLGTLGLHGGSTAAAVVFLRRGSPFPWRIDLGVSGPALHLADIARAALIVAWVYPMVMLVTGVAAAVQSALGFPVRAAPLLQLARGQSGVLFWASLSMTALVVAPLVEEFLFRHVLHNAFTSARVRRPSLLCAFVFAAVHLTPYQLPGLMLLGLVLQRERERSGGIRRSILVHLLFNAIALGILAAIRAFDIELPDLSTP
ncbi:MAG: CPBP family intramembrane metalloprotease [Lentisphaeria bacterium]|nr:CPBP family intramembrane metalloprotease [Lentisphaeria bacterium]